jgi:hypothetical protein
MLALRSPDPYEVSAGVGGEKFRKVGLIRETEVAVSAH